MYRHLTYPSENFQKFENFINDVIEHFNLNALPYDIAGDFNIDLLKYMIDQSICRHAFE